MIRNLRPGEAVLILPLAREVQALHVAAFPEIFRADPEAGEMRAYFEEVLSHPDGRILVYEEEAEIIAYLLYRIQVVGGSPFTHLRRQGFIDQICVTEDCQRRGVGRALVSTMLEHLRRQNVWEWAAGYWLFNATSAGFFEAIGAEPASIRALAVVPRKPE